MPAFDDGAYSASPTPLPDPPPTTAHAQAPLFSDRQTILNVTLHLRPKATTSSDENGRTKSRYRPPVFPYLSHFQR
jgi:hypothetical protein